MTKNIIQLPIRISPDKEGQKTVLSIMSKLSGYPDSYQNTYKNFEPFEKDEEFDISNPRYSMAKLGFDNHDITLSNSSDGISIYPQNPSCETNFIVEKDHCIPDLVSVFKRIEEYMNTHQLPEHYQATGTIDIVKNPFS